MSDTLTESPDTVVITESDNPIYVHIIDRGDNPKSAEALVLEARINGTELIALCGHKWVPYRDPQKFPLCPKCKEMIGFALSMRGII